MDEGNNENTKESIKETLKKLSEEFHAVADEALRQTKYNMQHSFKGKDGREYSDLDTVLQADEYYIQSENPKIPPGRHL